MRQPDAHANAAAVPGRQHAAAAAGRPPNTPALRRRRRTGRRRGAARRAIRQRGRRACSPGATPLEVIDVGQGQKLYLFGTNAPHTEIVSYYKNV
jgi:hypothetical protein